MAGGQPERFIIDFQEAWILSNTVLGVPGELQHRIIDGRRELCVCGLSEEALIRRSTEEFQKDSPV